MVLKYKGGMESEGSGRKTPGGSCLERGDGGCFLLGRLVARVFRLEAKDRCDVFCKLEHRNCRQEGCDTINWLLRSLFMVKNGEKGRLAAAPSSCSLVHQDVRCEKAARTARVTSR